MEYREIVAVTGIGGLFQLLTTKSDGAIVRNLTDKSTKFISARVHNVTPIESIEIYTNDENVRLHVVLQAIKDNEAQHPLPDTKAGNDAVKAYFKAVYPNLDEDRVYVSDMKKIVKWYELLKKNDMLNFDMYNQEEAQAEETVEETEVEAPAKKAKAKKAAEEVTEEVAEKPAKKARAKKAVAEEGAEEAPKKTARKKKTEE
ncbi:DUF5606 domain-containing protein [Rurimicrobium arvi]|uniref:DUF5606 domain-containing protein n=1 Tax=Rurimicrobium arvi TaxID=2049916 RepID=A0ABP8MHS1_9BACT